MQEVELTCEVTPSVRDRLVEKLAGLDPHSIVLNQDRYYDTPGFALFEQAVFVRVRTTEQGRMLQFKFDEPESDKQHVACTERNFPLSPGHPLPEAVHVLCRHFLPQWKCSPAWEEVCTRNELQKLVSIHNTRRVYQLGELTICLDQIEELGTFVEVEQMCEDGANTRQVRSAIQQFVADIGGKPLSAGYVEMALQRSRPEIYQRGQYHL
jgi:adenylate cyclase class IV